MINNRGTPASRNHTILCNEATCREFWDFGWHEIAIYDYPVTIDYVLKTTKQETLYFIGHSMGGTQYLVSYLFYANCYSENVKIDVFYTYC